MSRIIFQLHIVLLMRVPVEDVNLDMSYNISGTIQVNPDSGVTDDEVVSALTQTLSELLRVHTKETEVTFDPEAGEAHYSVSYDDNRNAEDAQTVLASDDFLASLTGDVSDVMGVSDVTVDPSISTNIDVEIDCDASTSSELRSDHETAVESLQDLGFAVDGETSKI